MLETPLSLTLGSAPLQQFGPHSIDRERNAIKKRYVIEVGNFGSIILRRNVAAFEKEINVLDAKIREYQNAIHNRVRHKTDQIVNELLAALIDKLKSDPPDHWQSRSVRSYNFLSVLHAGALETIG